MPLVGSVRQLPRPVWILFGGTFINKFGNFFSVFLVLYLTAKGYSAGFAGLTLGVLGCGNFAGNWAGGALADRLGRRRSIIISMFGSGVCTILVPFVGDVWLLVVLTGVIGVFSELYRPASSALLLDVVPENKLPTAFALYRLSINLGMATGPILGGILSDHSYFFIFAGDAFTSVIYGLIALAMLPETAPSKRPATRPVADEGSYWLVFQNVRFVFFLLSMLAATYVYVQSTATLPLQVKNVGLPNSFYGLLLGVNAVLVIAFELIITRLVEARPVRMVIAIGITLSGLGFGLTALAHSRSFFIFTVLLWTLAEMIMMPLASAYPGRCSTPRLRGRYQGAFGLAQTAGKTVGPVLGDYLYSESHSLNWIVCGFVAFAGVALVGGSRSPGRHEARRVGRPRYRHSRQTGVGGT